MNFGLSLIKMLLLQTKTFFFNRKTFILISYFIQSIGLNLYFRFLSPITSRSLRGLNVTAAKRYCAAENILKSSLYRPDE